VTGGRFVAAPADEATAGALAAAMPDNPFATSAYAESRRRVGYSTWVLAWHDDAGQLALGCLALLTTGLLNRTLELPSLPAADAASPFWTGLTAFCRQQRVTMLELDTFGSAPGVEIPPIGSRCTRRDRQEFVVDLSVDPTSQLGSNHKRNVKKAQKAGVQVHRTRSVDALAAHHALMSSSLDRRRSRGESVSHDAESNDHRAFLESGVGELFQALAGETVLSSVLVLRAATSGYYQSAGTSPDGMAVGASHFVIHAIAQALKTEGAQTFNLGGADEGSSLARFKEGFGARRVALPSAQCNVGPRWRRMATRGVELVRHDRATLRRLLLGQRSTYVVYAVDAGTDIAPSSDPTLSFRALSADEVRTLPVADAEFRARQLERLERFGASHAYGVWADGALAHVSWLLMSDQMHRDPPHVVPDRTGNAEITCCETLPAFRGRGIYGYAIRHLLRVARDRGARRVFMKTAMDNTASQSGIEKAGLSRVGDAVRIVLPVVGREVVWRHY
jgi:ribosomal protein S18 acetylase RimI-like enzyme